MTTVFANQLLDMTYSRTYSLTSENWGVPCYFCDIIWLQGSTYINIDQEGVSEGYFSLSAPVIAFGEYSLLTEQLQLSVVGVNIPLTVLQWGNFYTGFSAQFTVDWSSALTGNDYISGSEFGDHLYGFGGDDQIWGNGGDDVLAGGDGADFISGGTGIDSMSGGAGDDHYVVAESGDMVTEALNGGTDSVESSVTYTLPAEVENLALTGVQAVNGTGNSLANVLTGNSGANRLAGLARNDTMIGGGGNDIYVVAQAGDVVVEQANEGIDKVVATVSHTLAANVENLTLAGVAAINGGGNELNNLLTGNAAGNQLSGGAGNDTLDGGLGGDSLLGGAGNDVYVVDSIDDVVTEIAGQGIDKVRSAVGYTLGDAVENLTLTGALAVDGYGNELVNVLQGNAASNRLEGGLGNDVLDGGLGDDILVGGLGNDIYVVDSAGDQIVEATGEGVDTVKSYLTYTLAGTLERLTLLGDAAIDGYGNARNNLLTGNAAANLLDGGLGNDTLDGGAGNDTLLGGAGNDTYVASSPLDLVTEHANEGIDTVKSTADFTLPVNVENLILIDDYAISGTGNELDNAITGNANHNTLRGGAGNDSLTGGVGYDKLYGGTGDDAYWADSSDQLIEYAGEGHDTVYSDGDLFLYAFDHVEDLVLLGTAPIAGAGNGLDNVITGNVAANSLFGAGGNDTLHGGDGQDALYGDAGNDLLVGGAGPDSFVMNRALDAAANVDTLADFTPGSDRVLLFDDIFPALTGQTMLLEEQFHAAAGAVAAHDETDRIIQDTTTGALYYDADGIGGVEAIQFAVAGTTIPINLANTDFLIYP